MKRLLRPWIARPRAASPAPTPKASPRAPAQYGTLRDALFLATPILIPCFNALTYTKQMVQRLQSLGMTNIILMDNGSTYGPFVDYLSVIEGGVRVVGDGANHGPHHVCKDLSLLATLPDVFCITDPDIELGSNIPKDFVQQLYNVTEGLRVGKAGLALEIADRDAMIATDFKIGARTCKIWEWEAQFWERRVSDTLDGDPIYRADVDTTFAVYNKKYFRAENFFDAVRVAGRYTCRHLPWYRATIVPREEAEWYRERTKHSFYAGAEPPTAATGSLLPRSDC